MWSLVKEGLMYKDAKYKELIIIPCLFTLHVANSEFATFTSTNRVLVP